MISADRHTIINVIGGLMRSPALLSDMDKYQLTVDDFADTLDRYIFIAIFNLYQNGAEEIHSADIENVLENNSTAKNLLEKQNGRQYLANCEEIGRDKAFSYYYNKLKKYNLLRDLQKEGYDISSFYAENTLAPDAFEINGKFEFLTVEKILNDIKGKVSLVEKNYLKNNAVFEGRAVDGIRDLIVELKQNPEVGCHLQGEIFNTVCRGGRKGKLYIRSASSGIGKTRQAVGDACNIAYPIRFDTQKQEWVEVNRNPEKVLYIMTEQDPTEIQTMILAYLTGYNEEMFLYGTYGENEMPRIMKAVEIMEQYQDYLLTAQIPNPCAGVVKNLFRRYNFQEGVENFFYDYIFSSPAMLDEYRDLAIREDVCLRMFATELKNLAVELNAFVMTSTQISNDNNNDDGGFRDFKFIRGSKAIVDVADLACIMSRPSQKELETLGQLGEFVEQPNLVIDIFKNRRGRWTQVRIWSKNDLGCCRREDLFITNIRLEPIQGFKIANFSQQDNGYEIIEFNQDEISSEKELVIFNNKEEAIEAFGDAKKRGKDMKWDELLD